MPSKTSTGVSAGASDQALVGQSFSSDTNSESETTNTLPLTVGDEHEAGERRAAMTRRRPLFHFLFSVFAVASNCHVRDQKFH